MEPQYRILITAEHNPARLELDGNYFVRYHVGRDCPEFTNKIENAGIFNMKSGKSDDLMGNLLALRDRFGIRGLPEVVDEGKEPIDYRKLLLKYIQHVKEEEGADFICIGGSGIKHSDVDFTEEEKDELELLHKQADPNCEICAIPGIYK